MRAWLLFGCACAVIVVGLGLRRPVATNDGVRRITYWEKWTGFEGAAAQATVDAFNAVERRRAAREPDYRPIEVEMVTVSSLHQKLLVAIAGGDPPAVAGGWTWLVYSYSEKGALLPLDPFIARSNLTSDQFLPVFWDMCRYQGRTWALPTTPASTALHWNKRLFREAGLDPAAPPTTLAELAEYARRLTVWQVTLADGSQELRRGWAADIDAADKRLVQVGFLPNEPNWWPWAWGYYFGGRLWDETGRITASDPANVAAFTWARDWAERLGPEDVRRFTSGFGNFSSPTNPFMAGKVAMQLQGVWMYQFIDQYAPGLEWGAAPFPHPAGRPDLAGCNNVEADVLVMPRGCPHPEEAWQFMRFVASQQGMEILCLGHRKFSPLRAVSEEFRRTHPHPAIDLFRQLALHDNGFSTPKLGIWNEYKRELGVAFNQVFLAGADPFEALSAVEARIQASYDRNRARQERRRTAAEPEVRP